MVYIRSTISGATFFSANMLRDGGQLEALDGSGWVDCDFGPLNLYPGLYRIRAHIRKNSVVEYCAMRDYVAFGVVSEASVYGSAGRYSGIYTREGFVVPVTYRWGGGET
jgi:hypothetical protein